MGGRTHAEVIEQVEVDKLTPWPGNPRRGDVNSLADSMERFGMYQPIIVQKSTGYVIAGNHRLQAAIKIKMPRVPVIYADVDDEIARQMLIRDNRESDRSTNDLDALLALLGELDDPEGAGYTQDEIDKMLTPPVLPDDEPEPDQVGMQLQIVVDCRSAAQQSELLRKFEEEGLTAHARTV